MSPDDPRLSLIQAQLDSMRAVFADQLRVFGAEPAIIAAHRATEALVLSEHWNVTHMAYDKTVGIADLFRAQVSKAADSIAVSDGEGQWTYAELDRASDAIAAQIQNNLVVDAQRIGVALPRTRQMLAALLGVLKAGHAYVPVDLGQPLKRQREILCAGKVAAVIALPDAAAALTEGTELKSLDPDAAPAGQSPNAVEAGGEQPAYVIFTSGSTGKPKGVVIPHRAAVNFLLSMAKAPGLQVGDKVLAMTTICFDISVLELFLPLTVGAEVQIASREDVTDVFRIVSRVDQGDVTMVQATPTFWSMLVEAGFTPRPGLKMLAGGEPMPSDLAAKLTANGGELWNMYGPTETTIWSSLKRLSPGEEITVGAPVANTELHVLDEAGQLCPPGEVGELNIGGDGLALGYFEREDLTEAAFRDVSLGGIARRLYRTGDLAVRDAAGNLKVLGRRDGQVKLRGYRIELGEIEARLRSAPSVAAAAVDLRKGPSQSDQLVGFVVPRDGAKLDMKALAEMLALELPDYMVPTGWVEMAELPQTANGKLDRKALPGAEDRTPKPDAVQSNAPLNARLLQIWLDVLGREELEPDENLVAAGVDSLTLFRLVAAMGQAGFAIDMRQLLADPTLAAVARAVQSNEAPQIERPPLKDFLRLQAG